MDTISDILKDANNDLNGFVKKYGNNAYLRNLMVAAFDPTKKMLLPEGEPPFKDNKDLSAHITKGAFWQICKRMGVFSNPNLKSIVRENQFITALETVSVSDAKILLHAKDQTLTTLYPNLTYESLKAVGYFK